MEEPSLLDNSSANLDGYVSFSPSGIFESLLNAQGTNECGSRPSCLGWSDGCKQKQEAYEKCILNTQNQVTQRVKYSSMFGAIALVAIAVILIIIVLVTKKRK